jgi:hypothetical protein
LLIEGARAEASPQITARINKVMFVDALEASTVDTPVRQLCYGLDTDHVEPIEITKRVISGVYQGVTTVELDNLAAEVSLSGFLSQAI